MKVILNKDIAKVGREGEVVAVNDGYARNYLFPRGLAVEAAGGALRQLEIKLAAEDRKAEKLLASAQTAQAALEGKTVEITAKAGAGDRLFGSITAADIASAIQTSLGVSIDKRKVNLHDPIKAVGTFTVPVKLHRDITVELTVSVNKA
ncbi:MAG: 50S ribosomal protein L9 [Armatimonadaceae bacterium]